MGTPFSLEGKLLLPGAPGLPQEPIPYALLNQYNSKAEFEFNFPSESNSQHVDFGTMPSDGVKAMLVVYEKAQSSPPIKLIYNGCNKPFELSSGGFVAMGSPSPDCGITALSIEYTGAGRVRVWLLG